MSQSCGGKRSVPILSRLSCRLLFLSGCPTPPGARQRRAQIRARPCHACPLKPRRQGHTCPSRRGRLTDRRARLSTTLDQPHRCTPLSLPFSSPPLQDSFSNSYRPSPRPTTTSTSACSKPHTPSSATGVPTSDLMPCFQKSTSFLQSSSIRSSNCSVRRHLFSSQNPVPTTHSWHRRWSSSSNSTTTLHARISHQLLKTPNQSFLPPETGGSMSSSLGIPKSSEVT